MPKILQVNVSANWGSTGQIAEQCNQYAAKQGWDIYFAYGRYKNPGQSQLITTSSKWDVYEHYLENILFDNEGLASRSSTRRLINGIQRINPDIIHLHNVHDHWLNYKLLFEYLNQTGIKVVWTFHDFWYITGHCYHFVKAKCDKFIIECDSCPYTKGKILPFFKRTKRNFSLKRELFTTNENLHIVCVSDWVGENVAKSFLKNKDIRVIHNGVDTDIFKPTSLDVLNKLNYSDYLHAIDEKFVIMAVSSQWKSGEKGLDDYKKLGKFLNEDEVIVLVGVPCEISKDLPTNIIGIRRTNNQQELAALYTRADVVCSLSSAETFGLTIVEGYACGTPAIVYDNTAPPSLITPKTGYVVENGNYKQAYSAIQQIKKEGKKSYSDECIALARKKYSKETCFNAYMDLYNQILMD